MPLIAQSHVQALSPYELAEMGKPGAIQLASNEAAIPASPLAIEAAREATASPHLYPDTEARALREALGDVHDIEPERIVCTAGSMEVILYLALAYLGPGTEALTSRYGYLFFDTATRIAGGRAVRAEEPGMTVDIDHLLRAVTPETRILFLANPNNPTGTLLDTQSIRALERDLPDHVLLVLDAAYGEFVSDPAYDDGLALARESSRTVVLHTFSKIHGLAGMRIGWAYGPPDVVDMVHRLRLPNSLTAPSLAAAHAAVRDTAHVDHHRDLNNRLRALFEDAVTPMGLETVPGHGNFVLVRFPGGADQAAKTYDALKQRDIILRPMGGYRLPDCLRVTLGPEDHLTTAIDALRDVLA